MIDRFAPSRKFRVVEGDQRPNTSLEFLVCLIIIVKELCMEATSLKCPGPSGMNVG